MTEIQRASSTPLRKALQVDAPKRRATPLDAFNLARKKWMNSERVEMGVLAEELGVSRATLFRWVGNRELLIGEVIWSLCEVVWNDALAEAEGTGADYFADASYKMMMAILAAEPLRHFLDQDPTYALNILTSKTSHVQQRIVDCVRVVLKKKIDAGLIAPALAVDDLAYFTVRIVESCIYSDQITGRQPNVPLARDAIRILVSAKSLTQ